MAKTRNRPVYLNLFQFRFPATAIVSIGHRIAGVLLFLVIPLLIYLLDLSLRGPAEYERAVALLHSTWFRALALLLVWALAHHFLAGVRFLLIDIDVGVERAAARRSAWLVHVLSIMVVLAAVPLLW